MLEISWYLLFFGVVLLFIVGLKNLFQKQNVSSNYLVFTICIGILWFVYTHLVANSGLLQDLSLPPKMPILLIFPLLIFTGIFLFVKRNSTVLHSIPIHLPILYQSFRIFVEILIYYTFVQGILPNVVTFEGSNYDVLIGISAPFMAYFSMKNIVSKRVLVYWNIVGIIVVLNAAFTFITSFYFPQYWGFEESMISLEFIQFPFILLPAFLMPSAIFMHVLSIVQLSKKEGEV